MNSNIVFERENSIWTKSFLLDRLFTVHSTKRALNEIEITFEGTFKGWKSIHQGFRIYFVWNPRLKAIKTASLAA